MIDLSHVCPFCGKTARAHCIARDCLFYWTFCDSRLIDLDPRTWNEETCHDGRCLRCSHRIKDHYQHLPIRCEVDGIAFPSSAADVVALLPQVFTGCPSKFTIWF